MKGIIIICSQYPPMKHVASQRHYAFARYLSDYGYKVTVITDGKGNTDNGTSSPVITRIPATRKLPNCIHNPADNLLMHNTKSLLNVLSSQLMIDDTISWSREAYSMACKLIEKDNYSVILSSYAPMRTHLVALRLKRRFNSILWIADMRDELASDPDLPVAYRNYNPLLAYKEELVLNSADIISSVSKPLLDKLINRCSNPRCRFLEIRNGYDFDIKGDGKKNPSFTITYAGSMSGRDPTSFLTACEDLVTSGLLTGFVIQFIGTGKNPVIPNRLKDIVRIIPAVSYSESVNYILASDLLLLIIPHNNRRGVYTGKLFDYLGALKPILGLIPGNDVAAGLINDTNTGYVIDYKNIEAIKQCILLVYDNWEKGNPFNPNVPLINEHHRRNQTLKLIEFIETGGNIQ